MATYVGIYFGNSGVFLPQLKLELAAAFSETPAFVDAIITQGQFSSDCVFKVGLIDVETDEASTESQTLTDLAAAIASHTPNPNYDFTLAAPPWEPTVGQVQYLSDVIREGSGTGCLCWWSGEQWLRVSDNAIASDT